MAKVDGFKRVKELVGLRFVCEECGEDSLVYAEDIVNSGTPICNNDACENYDADMVYEGTYIQVKRKK